MQTMNQLLKLNAMHELIMGELAAEAVIQAGVLYAGWERDMSVQESRDAFKKQTKTIKQQATVAFKNLSDEDSKNIKRSLEIFEKDKKMLEFYIKYAKIHKDLFKPANDYIRFLNKLTYELNYAISFSH